MKGKRILVTRAREQAEPLCRLLHQHGAEPLMYPCIVIQPPHDSVRLNIAAHIDEVQRFDWIILTSVNVTRAIANICNTRGISLSKLAATRLAAVGATTAGAATTWLGKPPDLVVRGSTARIMAETVCPTGGDRVLLFRSSPEASLLEQELIARDAHVTAVQAYQVTMGLGGVDAPRLLAEGAIDAITLTSPSVIRYFIARLGEHYHDLITLHDICTAYIGPTTAECAQRYGLPVTVVAPDCTLKGLVAELATYFEAATHQRQESTLW